MSRMPLSLRLALRELRGGLGSFRVFLACLALGVLAVATVGSVRMAITAGLEAEGRAILGGDAQITTTYRGATEAEQAWMAERAELVSAIADFRSMAVIGSGADARRTLTQVKAVDAAYPLTGAVELDPQMPLAMALSGRGGVPGVVVEPALADRMGVGVGDTLAIGGVRFVVTARLLREPDRASGGFGFGPRSLVSQDALAGKGLLAPGTLYEMHHRLSLPAGADPDLLSADLAASFPDAGLRWRDARAAAPGIERFVERIGAFLVLVGLASLAVGGVGIAAAVKNHLEEKTESIAILKTLGATGGTIVTIYLLQVALLAMLGVGIGLVLGAGLPLLLGPLFAADLPVPALFDVYALPLLEAGLYGVLTALLFALWPLAQAQEVRPAALFRDIVDSGRQWPGRGFLLAILLTAAALAGVAVGLSGAPQLAFWVVLGVAAALATLRLVAFALRWGAGRLAGSRLGRGRPSLRIALAALGGPGGEVTGAVLALGLGLTTLAAIGQIDHNLRAAVDQELPDRAPAFFLIDIQSAQLDPALEALAGIGSVGEVSTAPMLRGIVTKLDGVPASEAEIDPEGAWILRGDRGVSYAAAPPPGTEILAGTWWSEDYAGPPLVSFSEEHARELRVGIGDTISVSILGREITAEIASLRRVDFSDMGINFLMIFDPGAFAGAPHTHIATVYAPPDAEGPILAALGQRFPNVTAIGVREAIGRVSDGLGQIAAAARWAALVTIAVGVVVLIGAAAAGARRRVYEAAVLKVLGASRGRILRSFVLRAGLTGAASGAVALFVGSAAGWAVMRFVLGADYAFEPVSAVLIVVGGALASLAAGLIFVWRALAVRPAQVLRAQG